MVVGNLVKRQKTVGVSFTLIAILGILIIALGVSPGWNLSWNVEEGDLFSFYVKGFHNYEILNDTVVIVNISTLPVIPSILTRYTFESSILEIDKISTTFENGTDTGQYGFFLISRAILPCGGWEILDYLYVNPEDTSFGPSGGNLRGYISKLESDYFYLGYEAVDFDASSGWNANISLETGIPYYIQYWRYDIFPENTTSPSVNLEYRVMLELFLI